MKILLRWWWKRQRSWPVKIEIEGTPQVNPILNRVMFKVILDPREPSSMRDLRLVEVNGYRTFDALADSYKSERKTQWKDGFSLQNRDALEECFPIDVGFVDGIFSLECRANGFLCRSKPIKLHGLHLAFSL